MNGLTKNRMSMNASLTCLLLSLALLAGCSQAPNNERMAGCGEFTFTNSTGTVFWGNLQDSATNDIQYVLVLPEADHAGCGSQTRGDITCNYCDLQTKRDGHQWKIVANGSLKTGTESLWFSDLTANTVTNIDLNRSRIWRISDDGISVPLDKTDSAIMERVLHESEAGFKQIQSLRKKN